ncbi:GtrA family protein [Cytobacillus oceanisediminis]|uniref:GtrA family protein n=1 Tax=Cytobacillus oceanisediminis TaxID=665099 RepID=UPI0023DBB47D|nr:GtrA family protein [Cytobacillus oceanisediminis]MDF2038293.1 GtrA family protein [Cytobacillus oceanisediminis]
MSSRTFILEHYLKRTDTFIRFLLVGTVNTIVGLSMIFMLLDLAGLSYWTATFLGNSTGAAVSYFLNRSFTFRSRACIQSSAVRFIFILFLSYILSYSISGMAAEFIQTFTLLGHDVSPEELAVLLGAGIYTSTNYIGQKYLVFTK